MNFDLSDDQRMLQDSVARYLADRYGFEQRTAHAGEARGWSQQAWTEFVELGLTMLPFREEVGGLGLGSVETMLVGEAFGRALVIEPYLPSIVLAGTAVAEGAGERAEALLAPILSGEAIGAFADDASVALIDGYLVGTAACVLAGDCADVFVVVAGDGAYVVPGDAAGLSRRGYRLHGGGGAADLHFDRVAVDAASQLAPIGVTRAREAGIAFLAAEAAGAMQSALDITVEYLKTREQFGKPIGTNQALQHRAAEMLVEVEQVKSAAIYAATLASETDDAERAKGFAAIKAVIGKSGRFVAQSAVQLHGGIGVSEEHIVSHWFRRLTTIGMILGSTQFHVNRLADLGGFTAVRRAA